MLDDTRRVWKALSPTDRATYFRMSRRSLLIHKDWEEMDDREKAVVQNAHRVCKLALTGYFLESRLAIQR